MREPIEAAPFRQQKCGRGERRQGEGDRSKDRPRRPVVGHPVVCHPVVGHPVDGHPVVGRWSRLRRVDSAPFGQRKCGRGEEIGEEARGLPMPLLWGAASFEGHPPHPLHWRGVRRPLRGRGNEGRPASYLVTGPIPNHQISFVYNSSLSRDPSLFSAIFVNKLNF